MLAVTTRLVDLGTVVVTGEPGIGKTSVLDAAVATLTRAGRGTAPAGPPVGPVCRGAGFATLRWQSLLPLQHALGTALQAGDAVRTAAEARRRVGAGLLVVDDAHWADEETRQVLVLLVDHVRLLVAVRSTDLVGERLGAELAAAGAAVQHLQPLPEHAALRMVQALRPDLDVPTTRDVLRRGAGNPLLLRELSRTGGVSPSLRLTLAARLRGLGPTARSTFSLLAVVGRPVPLPDLGRARDELDELERTGLVTVREGSATVTHPLLGELCVEQLDGDDRLALHDRAAGLPLRAGERARHLLAAGRHDAGYRLALTAAAEATSPGERGGHLAVAAECAASADRRCELRFEAAEAFLSAGEESHAVRLLDGPVPTDPDRRLRLYLLQSQTAWAVGEHERSARALDQADQVLAAMERSGRDASGGRLKVQLARARHALLADGNSERAVAVAREAAALARRLGSSELPRAQYLLGSALGLAGGAGYRLHLTEAIRGARQNGDHDLELRAGNNLVATHELAGDHDEGRTLAAALAARAEQLRLGAYVTQFRATAANLDMLDGRCEAALASCDELLNGILENRTRDQLEVTRTIALVDLGRFEQARAQIARSLTTAVDDALGRAQFSYLDAEIDLMLGRPKDCLDRLDALAEQVGGTELGSFVRLTRVRALADLGQVEDSTDAWPRIPFFHAAPVEGEAARAMVNGEYLASAELFDQAAVQWQRHYVRSATYCGWQSGVALLRADDPMAAAHRLESVEAEVERLGMAWQLARVRQSLRQAGVRRSARGGRTGQGLTGREAEVLRLASAGLRNGDIAARLGLARRTVETQLAAASAKLGATSRHVAGTRLEQP